MKNNEDLSYYLESLILYAEKVHAFEKADNMGVKQFLTEDTISDFHNSQTKAYYLKKDKDQWLHDLEFVKDNLEGFKKEVKGETKREIKKDLKSSSTVFSGLPFIL